MQGPATETIPFTLPKANYYGRLTHQVPLNLKSVGEYQFLVKINCTKCNFVGGYDASGRVNLGLTNVCQRRDASSHDSSCQGDATCNKLYLQLVSHSSRQGHWYGPKSVGFELSVSTNSSNVISIDMNGLHGHTCDHDLHAVLSFTEDWTHRLVEVIGQQDILLKTIQRMQQEINELQARIDN